MRFLFALILAGLVYFITIFFLIKAEQYNFICWIAGIVSATIVNPFLEWGLEKEEV